eukprot:gnl/Dysnectes_brevis/2479_a2962_1271.p1 GENE.gnl/Dysnectes_brevis/2479_a2962_1271~~gnl/Dysnectes_brevis/2479_a2962_1271.p1  ORF type:complete len:655 (-),score=149.65 gnl/Dysnectes_brevis/2479_a2962_1271:53-1969(-)
MTPARIDTVSSVKPTKTPKQEIGHVNPQVISYEAKTGEVSMNSTRFVSPSVSSFKAFLKDFVPYICFCIIFVLFVNLQFQDKSAFYLNQAIDKSLLVTTNSHIVGAGESPAEVKPYEDIPDFASQMDWLQGSLLNYIIPDTYYDGESYTTTGHNGSFLHALELVGRVRVRQVRVKSEEHEFPANSGLVRPFAPAYSSKTEATEDYRGFTWMSAADAGGAPFVGRNGLYPASGYCVDVGPTHTDAVAQLENLRTNRFFDEYTRLMIVEFTGYSPSLDRFICSRLTMEWTATGTTIPDAVFRQLDLLRYQHIDVYRWIVEGLLVLFVCFYLFEEINDMRVLGKKNYFRLDQWNVLDCVNLTLFFVVIGIRIGTAIDANTLMKLYAEDPTQYINFQRISTLTMIELSINSLNGFLIFFKVFKYISRVSIRLSFLQRTLTLAMEDLAIFVLVFLVIFVGSAISANLLFGNDLYEFSTIFMSLSTLFSMILGGFDYMQLYDSNRFIAPIFFITFMSLCVLILLNCSIAIILDAFDTAKKQHKDGDMLKTAMLHGYRLWRIRNKKVVGVKQTRGSLPVRGSAAAAFDDTWEVKVEPEEKYSLESVMEEVRELRKELLLLLTEDVEHTDGSPTQRVTELTSEDDM